MKSPVPLLLAVLASFLFAAVAAISLFQGKNLYG
jgi:hypothetical protein